MTAAVDRGYRDLVPQFLVLPCEHTDAVISVPLAIGADPVLVYAPGLNEVKAALAVGSFELVKSYCEMWTRFLALAGSGLRRAEQ